MSVNRTLNLTAMAAVLAHNDNIKKLVRDKLSEMDGPCWNTEHFQEVFTDKANKPLLYVVLHRDIEMDYYMRIDLLDEKVERFVIQELGKESLSDGLYHKNVVYYNLGWDNISALEEALDRFYNFMAGLNLFLRMEKRKPLDT